MKQKIIETKFSNIAQQYINIKLANKVTVIKRKENPKNTSCGCKRRQIHLNGHIRDNNTLTWTLEKDENT